MFDVRDYTISMSRGDTGAIKVNTDTDYEFSSNDRVLFSIKNALGEVVRQQVYPLEADKSFVINFANSDTDYLPAGTFSWDLRYIINPYYDETGTIVSGDQVITPKAPMELMLLQVVGEV